MKNCNPYYSKQFNKDLQRNGILVLFTILLGCVAGFLSNTEYIEGTLLIILGILFVVLLVLPNLYKYKTIKWNGTVADYDSYKTYKKSLKFAYVSMSALSILFLLIGCIVFMLAN